MRATRRRRGLGAADAARGGVKTLYPEYRATLNGSITVDALKVPASSSAVSAEKMIAAQSPRDGQVHVLPVQGNVYMLVADGTNITASLGADGVTLVNTGAAADVRQGADGGQRARQDRRRAAAANRCSGSNCPGHVGLVQPLYQCGHHVAGAAPPIRYVINTSAAPDYSGGNEKLATAGSDLEAVDSARPSRTSRAPRCWRTKTCSAA